MRTIRSISLPLTLTFPVTVCSGAPAKVASDTVTMKVPFTIWLGNYPLVIAKQPNLPVEYFWLGGDYVLALADNKELMQSGDDFNSIYYTCRPYAGFLAETGVLHSAPNLDKLIDSSFLL